MNRRPHAIRAVLFAASAVASLGALGAGCGGDGVKVEPTAVESGTVPAPGDGTPTEAGAPETGAPNTCGATTLLANPEDLSAKGAWAVGAKHATVGGLSVEIWYPANLTAAVGQTKLRYDIRDDLPANQATKITDEANPYQPCNDCYRDLPLDAEHGPYPLVVFIHGTAGFKTQNLDNMVHWASRGFIVMAANHPGLSIGSFVGGGGQQNLKADVEAEIAGMKASAGALASFAGHVDFARLGLAGHSAGGNGVSQMGDLPGVGVIVELSSGNVAGGASDRSALFVSGLADTVAAFSNVKRGYDDSKPRKRLVGITDVGHTGVTSLCGIQNAKGESIVEVAIATGVLSGPLAGFAGTLFDCAKNKTPQSEAIPIVNFATAGVLEEKLHCSTNVAAALDTVQAKFPRVATYAHAP